ncbi:GNAT family N-acetyltransferase [Micromonospora sp. BRA006-A]|nr:GNAT family N-acetyltransferase [Micromonospora sp. BRA006-A]
MGYGELWVERDDDEAELAHVLVAPQQRRRGLGRRLARNSSEPPASADCTTSRCASCPDNTPAIDCYRSAGSYAREPTTNACSTPDSLTSISGCAIATGECPMDQIAVLGPIEARVSDARVVILSPRQRHCWHAWCSTGV